MKWSLVSPSGLRKWTAAYFESRGWLFRGWDQNLGIHTTSTFVPFNNEFMRTSEQGESPATDRQQLNYAIAQAYEFAKLCSDSKASGTMHSFVEWLEQRAAV